MTEIELSYIPDADVDIQSLQLLLDQFTNNTGTIVKLHPLDWASAWTDLMTIATHGKGPDISHIGGSWVSSLALMNALRPFKAEEIEAIGGSGAYLDAIWSSTSQFHDDRTWAVPWTGYIYVICYRKDLFTQAGIDVNNAFSDYAATTHTLQTIQQAQVAEIPWLNPAIPAPYTDLLHIAASWVWSAGGDFLTSQGDRVVFDSDKAIAGLCGWLETYRLIPAAHRNLDWDQTVDIFKQGRSAAMLTDIRIANDFIAREQDKSIRENYCMAPIASVPWAGGGSFVIWRHVLGFPEREQAALALLQFLNTRENSQKWAQDVGAMPARLDALRALFPPENPLYNAIQQTIQHGRTYQAVPLWRRIEYQIAQELAHCIQEAYEKPTAKSEDILRTRLAPLAKRLNLTLGN